MRIWISAILIAILAGALQAGNGAGHDDIPLVSGGDAPVVVPVVAPGLAPGDGAGPVAEDRAVEFAFVRLLRGAGNDVAGRVGRVRVKVAREVGQNRDHTSKNRQSGAVYGFGVAALLGDGPAPGGNGLRRVFDDLTLGAALPAIDRFRARVWFGF